MSSTYGENLHLTIFGQSHSPAIGVTVEGIPAGEKVDLDELQRFLNRRAPGINAWSTPRKEADAPEILSGLVNGYTCGAPLTAIIRNTNTRSQDYANLAVTPRPGHADYTAEVKYGGYQDRAGGGHFSGRLTAPLCIAGGICLQILAREGITVVSRIASIAGISDEGELTGSLAGKEFPVVSDARGEEMRAAIERLRTERPLKGLVLDYRSNGGGIMQEAVKILGMFVPKGTEVVSTKGRSEDSKQVFRTDTEPILADLPLTVLINGNSASAAEIVAGALQDLDRAVLIGQRSFGKGLVQSPRPLGYNAMLKLTTAKYYIPSGRCIQAIDYSHSQEGSVRAVPDSLISEFTTRAGRKVYDGGGVMPDIATDPEYISRFALTLYALGFIEDFGDEYTRRNPGRQIDIRTFSITDKDYADFAEFMQDKKVPYESDTRRALKALKKAAEDDRFADLKNKFEQVEAELKDDTQTNLETYRTQVVETINNDIVMRHGYQAGVIEHSLSGDKEVKKAVEVLGDPAEYARITREQDTKRK